MARVENVHCPDDLYYEPEAHLWVKVEDEERARIGIDELGRWAAGTISFLEFQLPGKRIHRRGGSFGTLEANKFVGALKAPVRGVIREINHKALENPRLANCDPYGEGWFIVVEPTHLEEDLRSLVHGEEAIARYLREKIAQYREKGILPEEAPESMNENQEV